MHCFSVWSHLVQGSLVNYSATLISETRVYKIPVVRDITYEYATVQLERMICTAEKHLNELVNLIDN